MRDRAQNTGPDPTHGVEPQVELHPDLRDVFAGRRVPDQRASVGRGDRYDVVAMARKAMMAERVAMRVGGVLCCGV